MARLVFVLLAVIFFTAEAAEPTACDLLATHPLDPDQIAPGVPSAVVRKDLDTAIAVCRTAVDRFPDNPRLNYNLGRVLFYAKQFTEGLKYIDKAAAGGHRQAQFVTGLIYSRGSGGTDVDHCRAVESWLSAARGGHYGSALTLAQRYLAGETQRCVELSSQELRTLLDNVRTQPAAGDYFHGLLFDTLDAALEAKQ